MNGIFYAMKYAIVSSLFFIYLADYNEEITNEQNQRNLNDCLCPILLIFWSWKFAITTSFRV